VSGYPSAVAPGTIVAGRYEIVALIGSGGMGAVYRAVHTMSRREVALKVITTAYGHTPEVAIRFQREASAPAAIGHPGIVAVHDAGVDPASGSFFLTMELLAGTSLRDRMGPAALPWLLALLEPLAAAHARGFVHRDLKPENVFIDRSQGAERVKLLDFGIARRLEDVGVTATGTGMGTPHYMAPEQAMSARDVGPRADVYSVGVMLYEAITGRVPYAAPSMAAMLVQMQSAPLPPISSSVAGVHPSLSSLVERCLSLDPAIRPADAGTLHRELARLLPPNATFAPSPVSHAAEAFADTLAPGSLTADQLPPPPQQPPAPHAPPAALPAPPPSTRIAAPRSGPPLGCLLGAAAAFLLAVGVAAAIVLCAVLGERDVETPPAPADFEILGEEYRVAVPVGWAPVPPSHPEYLVQYGEPEGAPVRRQVAVGRVSNPRGAQVHMLERAHTTSVTIGAQTDVVRPAQLAGRAAHEARFYMPHERGAYRQQERAVDRNGMVWVVMCVGPAEDVAFLDEGCARFMNSFQFRE
jgi:hypothetical protein